MQVVGSISPTPVLTPPARRELDIGAEARRAGYRDELL